MKNYLSLIKFSHTIFALPFAIIGFVLGMADHQGVFNIQKFLLMLACMVFARSAAMAFNRYIDRAFDEKNPRTQSREIPAGIISPSKALLYVIINSLLFVLAAYFINTICFYLSPVALMVVLGYSYTKRFTAMCHFVLGLGLALAPIGAYLSVTATFNMLPIWYSLAVITWVSGFDIIYAMQDVEIDNELQLNSIPNALGKVHALQLSSLLHVLSFLFVLIPIFFFPFGIYYWIGLGIFATMLIYQHSIVKPTDLSKVNIAFMTTNGIASVAFAIFFLLDYFIK
ncbi:MAG: UbiA-like polyprenyltransferase [Sphingobacteriaceae bacterium]